MRRAIWLFVVGSLFIVFSVEAQVTTGNMIGAVRDESGAVLPGVNVTALSPARAAGPAVTVTNERGAYRIVELPPGTYELRIELPGFRTYVEQDLRITVGGTIERNITLLVGAVAETITVSGQAPVVDPRQTGVIGSLAREAVEAVPITRSSLGSWMATMPGVAIGNYNYGGAGVNVMGSNASSTSYVIDGMLTNRANSWGSFAWHDMDAAEEINLTALGASSEYQLAQGGVMNLVTKSGTNAFRGDGQYYWAPQQLVSAPVKLACNCPLGETGYKQYTWQDWSVHLGGPILRDRLWFHTGLTNTNPIRRNPGQPERPKEQWFNQREVRSMSKVTLKITDKIQFQQNFNYEYWHWLSPTVPTIASPLETLQRYTGDIRYYGSEVTASLTSSTVLTARFLRNTTPQGYVGLGPNLKNDLESQLVPGRFDTFTGISRDNATGDPSRHDDPVSTGVNVKLNTYVSGSRMTQNIRFGVQIASNRDTGSFIRSGGVLYRDFNGAPNEAQFEPPGSYKAAFKSQGVWFEDEINISRMTIVPGIRFDRMDAISPTAPVFDATGLITNKGLCRCGLTFKPTSEEIPGLGDLFRWNKVSPRVGMNVRLTSDSKTILRATAGRYYSPIFINDFAGIHPGRPLSTLMGFDPATGGYTRLLSVTDARANIGIDQNIEAPYNDQYSIAIERQIGSSVSSAVTYVRKSANDLIGWRDIGGVYGEQTVTAPNGQPVTVFRLLNSPSERKFLRTNGPGYYNLYNGVVFSLNRRMANRWMLGGNYTFSKGIGLDNPPGGASFATSAGQDPNDQVNFEGRLSFDRPHMLGIVGAYEIPVIEVQVSGNLSVVSGNPYGPQIQVNLPQGRRNIYYEEPGSYRTPTEKHLIFRGSKILFRGATRRIELGVELRNALQQTRDSSIVTRVFLSPNFGTQGSYPIPRQLMFRARAYF